MAEQHGANAESISVTTMSAVERLGSICRVLDEQCDEVVTRFAIAEAVIQALRAENASLAVSLLAMERGRDAAILEAGALKVELATLRAAEQATRDMLHAQEEVLARTGLSGGFDEAWYLREYPDVRIAVEQGRFRSGLQHYLIHGHKEAKRQPMPLFTADSR